jgi:hypothetical protein
MPEDLTAGTTPDPTVPVAGATGSQPDLVKALNEAQEWRTRFTGLQGKYQQEQAKWAGDSVKLMELTEQLTKLTGEKEATSLELTSAKEKLDTLATEKELAQLQLERLNIVTNEFPSLIPFLKDDLIPDDTGDELREKLKKLDAKLLEIKGDVKAEHVKGASPPSSPPPAGNTPQALLTQAKEAMVAGNIAEYNRLYDMYIQSKKEA